MTDMLEAPLWTYLVGGIAALGTGGAFGCLLVWLERWRRLQIARMSKPSATPTPTHWPVMSWFPDTDTWQFQCPCGHKHVCREPDKEVST